MPAFVVTVETTVVMSYIIEADSREDARNRVGGSGMPRGVLDLVEDDSEAEVTADPVRRFRCDDCRMEFWAEGTPERHKDVAGRGCGHGPVREVAK